MKRIITLSTKHQITLPAPMLRQLDLQAGDRLVITQAGKRLVLTRLSRSITEQTAGSLKRFVPKEKLGRPWKAIIETTKEMAAKELAKEGTNR